MSKKKIMIAISLALALTSAARADAVSLKITVEKAIKLYSSLTNLSGPPGADGRPVPYKLGAAAEYAMLVDLDQLSSIVKAYQASYKSAFADVSKDRPDDVTKDIRTGAPVFREGSAGAKALEERMDRVQSVELNRIKFSDLNIGTDPVKTNQIAPNAMVGLMPILDQ